MVIAPVLATLIVGSVFLFAGGTKLLAPFHFCRYLAAFGFHRKIPFSLSAITITIGFVECLIGSLLCFHVAINFTSILAIILLLSFNFAIFIGKLNNISPCLCYGERIKLNPLLSIFLTIFYIALLGFAWYAPAAGNFSQDIQKLIFITSVSFFLIIICVTHWLRQVYGWGDGRTGRLLIVGDRWRNEWLDGFTTVKKGANQIIVFMHKDCQKCKTWISVLNKISARQDIPQLIVALAGDPPEIAAFQMEYKTKFPVLPISISAMERLVDAYPTVCIIKNNQIIDIEVGRFPEEIVKQLALQPTRMHIEQVSK